MTSSLHRIGESHGLARRALLVAATGVFVVVAGVVAAVVLLAGGDDEPDYPPARPLRLAAPATLDEVFTVSGEPAQLPPEEVDAIVSTVRGYLDAATIAPLEYDAEAAAEAAEDGDDGEELPPPPPDLGRFFTDEAAARLDGEDRRALADDHLPHAEHGVSTEGADLRLAALLDEAGAGQVVSATIDVRMVVRLDEDAVIVERSGELVLERVDDAWRIGAYHVRVNRTFASTTTTTGDEAAFG